jgi:hypothetical protein
MIRSMNLQTHIEILNSIRVQYQESDWQKKGETLDGFIAASGHDRKYAIRLLNSNTVIDKPPQTRQSRVQHDDQVRQTLISL